MKSVKTTPRILPILITTIIFFTKAMGLLPFNWDKHNKTLTRYRFPLVYPILFLVLLFSSVIYTNLIVLPNAMTKFSSDSIKLTVVIMNALTVLQIVFTYVRHYSALNEIEEVFHECFTIWRTIHDLEIHLEDPGRQYYFWLIMNYFVNPLVQFGLIYIRMAFLDLKSSDHFVLIAIIGVPNILTSLVPNLFHNIMLVTFYVLNVLNIELKTIVSAIKELDVETPFRIQKQFCDLSDRLDAISQLHLEVIRVVQRINNLLNINLMLWIMVKACITLLMCFSFYMCLMRWAFVEGFVLPIEVFISGILSIVMISIELVMFVNICWKTTTEVKLLYIIHASINYILIIIL